MISYCLREHAQRIGALPLSEWKAEVAKLPERCEHDDCSTGNCRKVCQEWLRMQFMMRRDLRRMGMPEAERIRTSRSGK